MPDSAQATPQKSVFKRFAFRRILPALAALLLIYALAGFFLAPLLIKSRLKGYVETDLGRRLAIERVRVNPFRLSLELEGASLTEADGKPLLAFDRFGANVQLRSLADWAWVFSEVRLERPRVHLRISPDGVFNVARLIADVAGEDTSGKPPATPEPSSRLRLDFRRLTIRDGALVVSDASQPTPAEAVVTPITLEVSNLTTLPGNDGRQTVSATLPHGGILKWKGRISLMPFSSRGELSLRRFNEGVLWEFLRRQVGIQRPEGTIDLDLQYHVGYGENGFRMTLDHMSMRVDNLVLALKDQPDDPLLKMEEIRLSGGRFDLDKYELVVEEIRLSRGRLQVAFDSRGAVNWERIVGAGSGDDAAGEQEASLPFAIRLKRAAVKEVAVNIRDHSWRDPLEVTVKSVNATLSARLRQPAEGPFETRLDDIEMALADTLVGAEGAEPVLRLPRALVQGGSLDDSRHRLSAAEVVLSGGSTLVTLGKNGRLNWQRLFTPVDAAAAKAVTERIEQVVSQDWSVQLAALRFEDFDIALRDQYIAEAGSGLKNVKVDIKGFDTDPKSRFQARVAFEVLHGGRGDITATVAPFKPAVEVDVDIRSVALAPLQPYLDTVARLKLASGALSVKGQLDYDADDGLKWRGTVQLADMGLTLPDSGDKLASLKQMVVSGMAFDQTPAKLSIKSIRLVEPFLKLTIRKDMSVNLGDVLVDKPADKSDTPAADPPAVLIEHVRIEKATMDFADRSLPLPFEVFIEDLAGGVSGISTTAGARAAIELNGRVRPYGGVKIKGVLLPWDPARFAEIITTFRNIDMPELTPYSAKFAGREITSGKMNLDLVYRIQKSKLKGENRIVLDNFELGRRVESPDAVNLPLDLAVALLKDSQGRIDIGLEVTGDVSDPQFSYGHLVWKALLNLIQKIVTAPFQALASLLGGKGQGIDSIAFEPGRVDVPPPEAEKLARLAGVLGKRPNLMLEVKGCYDPETDAAALREARLRREMASRLGLSDAMQHMRGPLMLDDPAVRQALETLAAERLAPAEVAAAKAEAGVAAESKGNAGKKAALPPGMAKYYQKIYHLLAAKVPLEKEALNKLAAARAAGVAAAMQAQGLSPQRMTVSEETQTAKTDKQMVRCGLGLDVKK